MHAYFGQLKSPMGTLYKHISLKLIAKFISWANERKRSSWRTCFDRPHVCSFGNIVFIAERKEW